ncbi:MAG: Gfo/Idh/MocA family oxidoreductase [Kiritimatiellae bacterium]|jgi:dihydrodiol dehydrogenase / D-xylose 1-dehydrogenase (NADP)|nr:Gfo/Idh/MocA family oxidoreductase [Kiritimatiellia bacterium]
MTKQHSSKSNSSDTCITWGILGAGGIANKFAEATRLVEACELVAVAGRTPGKAKVFAERHGVQDHYESYEELLAREDIDAVYVATTHNFHEECVTLALEAGKHVMCEKPFTVNAQEAEVLGALARAKGLFMMEAMWTRFLPCMRQAVAWLKEGRIGEIRQVRANFSFNRPFDPQNRLYNRELAGGALLDAGIYPVSFASMVMGRQPDRISSMALTVETGVDAQSAFLFDYGNAVLGVLSTGCNVRQVNRAEILGSEGTILFPESFHGATSVELHRYSESMMERHEFPHPGGNGFTYEVEEACACIRKGRTESPEMTIRESIELMRTLDTIRGQWGLRYPGED